MHGNVSEWCEDGYETMGSGTQDAVEGETSTRVLRGGSWFNNAYSVRSSNRNRVTPDYTSYNLGFRVAKGPL